MKFCTTCSHNLVPGGRKSLPPGLRFSDIASRIEAWRSILQRRSCVWLEDSKTYPLFAQQANVGYEKPGFTTCSHVTITPNGADSSMRMSIFRRVKDLLETICMHIVSTTLLIWLTIRAKSQLQQLSLEVNRIGNSSIRTEVSYLNGIEVNHGTKGSIHFDVVQYNANRTPVAAWDLKTGSAVLTEKMIEQMQAKSGLSIPIHMVK